MEFQLTPTEMRDIEQLLKDYQPAQEALVSLKQRNGNFDASFNELWSERVGSPQNFGAEGKSLWQVTLKVLRQEICSNQGFRSKILDYNKNPGSASLLTGAIVYMVGLTTLPIDPAIATIIVLYIIKVGLNIFCEYTEPN